MAILKQRLKRYNGSTYDTVHLETETSCISDFPDVATMDDLAPVFSTSTDYGIGDYVTYDGKVYRCTATHSAGAWNSNYFTEVKAVGQRVTAGKKIGTTLGAYATAEGNGTTASGTRSHAEGYNTTASGGNSHAEGSNTTASGAPSHAEGVNTTASGYASHAEGRYVTANHASQHVFGEFNIADTNTTTATSRGDYVEIVGNGMADNARSNARTLDWNGNEVLSGSLTATKVNAASNENLLDNWYFVGGGNQQGGGIFPINSKGSTSENNTIFICDRWKYWTSGSNVTSVDLTPDGIKCTGTSGGQAAIAFEVTPNSLKNFLGKQLTATALFSDGTLSTATGTLPTSITADVAFNGNVTASGSVDIAMLNTSSGLEYASLEIARVNIYANKTVVAVKTELGGSQTLVHRDASGNWVLNEIPDYQKELFKCQTSTDGVYDVYSNRRNLVEGMAQSNRNLLNNWYFMGLGGTPGHDMEFPINQRNGYTLLPNVHVYSDSNLTQFVETTTDYTFIKRVIGAHGTKSIEFVDLNNNTRFVSPNSAPVNGYYGTGWTIDKWYCVQSTVFLSNAGVTLNMAYGGSMFGNGIPVQELPPEGTVLTFSVLLDVNNTPILKTCTAPLDYSTEWPNVFNITDDYMLRFRYNNGWASFVVMKNWNSEGVYKSITIKAVKVEIGYNQTLARNIGTVANPSWTLNDFPDYYSELKACQHDLIRFGGGDYRSTYNVLGQGYAVGGGICFIFLNFPEHLRFNHATSARVDQLSGDVTKMRLYDSNSRYFTPTGIAIKTDTTTPNAVQLEVYINQAASAGPLTTGDSYVLALMDQPFIVTCES